MLVWRRANSARSLLAAATAAALIAIALLAGLSEYNRTVIVAGGKSAVAAAPPQERSVLLRGPSADKDEFERSNTTIRQEITGGFPGTSVAIAAAGYSSGRRFSGDTGTAVKDSGGLVYSQVMFLEGMQDHGKLQSGQWPQPGATPTQAVLGAAAAQRLGVTAGELVPITNTRTKKITNILVTGILEAAERNDPFWLLTPELFDGAAPGTSTYGPLVLDRSDFFAGGWSEGGNAAWVVEPDLVGADLDALINVRRTIDVLPKQVLAKLGYHHTGQSRTDLGKLVDRLQRADLVGRSALLTPLLLIVVLGGYALLLLASLLTEQRRAETALLRARGASRGQLAGLATREALLVALPAALLAPLLVTQLLTRADQLPALALANVHPDGSLTTVAWIVAAAAGLGCVLAMMGPALRHGGTYIEDLAARSRPSRGAMAQRAGVDLALVFFAGLAWFQLQQYESPLAGVGGQLGVDPLLAAAAPIGVLAGAVLALRLLPPLTKLAERLIDRRPWFATQLGMWQAGRRPHAGPVLLLALAVAVSTLAWTLAATAQRSLTDQANHTAGTDLRLTETAGFAPTSRGKELAGLPGVTAAVPAWRTALSMGPKDARVEMLALDTAVGADMLRLRSDLGDARQLLGELTNHRITAASVPLAAGATELRGKIEASVLGVDYTAMFVDENGAQYRVPITTIGPDFRLSIPDIGKPLALGGFVANGGLEVGATMTVTFHSLQVLGGGKTTALDLASGGAWTVNGDNSGIVLDKGRLTASYTQSNASDFYFGLPRMRFAVGREIAKTPIPALATTGTLATISKEVGDVQKIMIGGTSVEVKFYAAIDSIPGVKDKNGILLDLVSLSNVFLHRIGASNGVQEWWLATDPAHHAQAAAAADQLINVDVVDRVALRDQAGKDPYGVGARVALFIAAFGAIALALVGVAVDVRATARRRVSELAVLHTLGASPGVLARALITEQTFLAGLGVVVGLGVGAGAAALMAPLMILTPTADRPVPSPVLAMDWQLVTATAGGLLLVAVAMAGMVAVSIRSRLATAQLRIGADR